MPSVTHIYLALQERAAERCRRTQRPAHLGTSTDNFLTWKHDDAEGSSRPSTPRPGTSSPQVQTLAGLVAHTYSSCQKTMFLINIGLSNLLLLCF